jgi:hypothetical protein
MTSESKDVAIPKNMVDFAFLSAIDDQNINVAKLSGLELAKYVQLRLANEHDSIEKIAENFDNDIRFVLGVVYFLTVSSQHDGQTHIYRAIIWEAT